MNKMIIIIIASILLLVVAFLLLQNSKDTYVSSVTINKPYNDVWDWISNPLTYEKIYPHWVKSVQKVDDAIYHISDQFGHSYNAKLHTNKEYGIVDLMIGKENSRARLIDIDGKRTLVVHIAKRWDGFGHLPWFFHKITTWRDFRTAKKVIEQQ